MRERISRHSGQRRVGDLDPRARRLEHRAGKCRPSCRRSARSTGHQISAKPRAGGILLLGKNKKFPAAAIPTVKNASELSGKTLTDIEPSCPPATVNLGTWCLMDSPYPLTNAEAGQNNYFWASQACVKEGGYLPTAAQLIGAANRVKLESTIHDSQLTATIPLDPSVGLKDQREMSATLVTTAAGSDAAGSEGVSVGSTGRSAHRRTEPGAAAGCAGPFDAAVRDGLLQRHQGRLRRLAAGLRTAELPLCFQRDAGRQHERRRVRPVAFTESSRVRGL